MHKIILPLIILCALTAAALSQTTVSGRVTGVDGKPMILANAFLRQPFDTATVGAVDVARDGGFLINVPWNGIWFLTFTGVHHAPYTVALYVDGRTTIHVDVKLAAYTYLKSFENVRAFGSFNNWYNLASVPLKRQGDGSYVARIKTNAASISYMLSNVRYGGSVEGTQAAEYTYKWFMGYESTIPAKDGIAIIVFNPSDLQTSSERAKAMFVDAPPIAIRFNEIYNELVQYQDDFKMEFRKYMSSRARQPHKAFTFDFSGPISTLEKQLGKEKNAVLRSELYFDLLSLHVMNQASDPSFYTKVLKEISPSSMIWALEPHDISFALLHSTFSTQKMNDYIHRVLKENPVTRVKSALLYDEFMSSKLKGDKRESVYFYDLITREFKDTPEGEMVAKHYSPGMTLAEGSLVPAFSVVSMDNMVRTITDRSLRGKYYLMFFWAAEYPASANQIKYLSSAYQTYKDRNFEILTLSVDSSFADVARFRKDKWKMPWLNAYLGRDKNAPVIKAFKAYEIPKAFLINPEGVIVAMGKPLMGPQLIQTLSKYLGQ
ncbi:MAG: peroxiredoxin family protein [Bacteroidetes bacterium]|nr:peroxiredoxin family protein [Bacteroidota bacterium]